MSPTVKKILRNYLKDIEGFREKMGTKEYIHYIKSLIRFLNGLEKDNLLGKVKNYYPMTHPFLPIRKIPINFQP